MLCLLGMSGVVLGNTGRECTDEEEKSEFSIVIAGNTDEELRGRIVCRPPKHPFGNTRSTLGLSGMSAAIFSGLP